MWRSAKHVSSARAPSTYSKMTRKTSRKVSMKGKSSHEMLSAWTRKVSLAEDTVSSRADDSTSTGRMNSSDAMVRMKMHPNTATTLEMSDCQSTEGVRGYSSS